MTQEVMLLIDGNSLVYRAFHAIPPLSTASGLPTNAVYGFTNMLFGLLKKEAPRRVVVAFDVGKKTFRNADYPEYKAHRPATPDDLQLQFPLVKEIVCAMGIHVLELENYEADDILGTLAAKAEMIQLPTAIVTGDRDLLQLVSANTKVILAKKGYNEQDIYDEDRVLEKYGVSPALLVDMKGMTGDPSDNIPGVKGIGEKTAAKLLQEYGSLEEILAHIDQLPPRHRNRFLEHRHLAELSKKLATICREVPIEIDLDQYFWQGPDYDALLALLKRFEFKSLQKSIFFHFPSQGQTNVSDNAVTDTEAAVGLEVSAGTAKVNLTDACIGDPSSTAAGGETGNDAGSDYIPGISAEETSDYATVTPQIDYQVLEIPQDISDFMELVQQQGAVALALQSYPHNGIKAVALGIEKDTFIILVWDHPDTKAMLLDLLNFLCHHREIKLYCHNGKELIKLLHSEGITQVNLWFDTMLAAYLLNPSAAKYALGELAIHHLDTSLPEDGSLVAAQANLLTAQARCIFDLAGVLQDKLESDGLADLYRQVELPLIQVLADMETLGVRVEKNQLEEMSQYLGQQLELLMEEVYSLAGHEFNLNSPKQLGQVLFEELGLPTKKKTKTGYSTDASVLEKLAEKHEIAVKILDYRQLAKLKSTYTDGLAALIDPETNRLHTTFHQTVTATGRLSSSDPNLQNIPVRMEQGRLIRKVFVPSREGNVLLAADYSQIELRVLAHLSEDPVLIAAFNNREDIHTRTAAEILGIPPEAVTPDARQKAKAINFGIVYGLSDFGLARDIKISRAQAKEYITNYLTRYAGVKEYMDHTIALAYAKGYVTTLLNRRRHLPDLFSSNKMIRSACERIAINTPVQGSAADIIKLAMLEIHRAIEQHQLKSKMILQVHDELIFDTPAEETAQLREIVKTSMENAYTLKVPLEVVIKTGPNWHDMRGEM